MWPKQFGPYIWPVTHLHAFRYSTAAPHEQAVIRRYFADLPWMLPCPGCQWHAAMYMKEHPVDWSNLFKWSVDFHNAVNKRLGKREFTEQEAFQDLHKRFFDMRTITKLKSDEDTLKLYMAEKVQAEEDVERWRSTFMWAIVFVILTTIVAVAVVVGRRMLTSRTSG